jgi:hypothetical protein
MKNHNKLNIKNLDYVHRKKASYEVDVVKKKTFKIDYIVTNQLGNSTLFLCIVLIPLFFGFTISLFSLQLYCQPKLI